MLLSEITYDLFEVIRGASIIDDEKIDKRLLINWINNQRSTFIKRQLDKGETLDNNLLQTEIGTLEIIDSSLEATLNSFKNILRTTTVIIPTIELRHSNAILEVSSPDVLENTFSLIPFDQLRWSGNSKFNSKQWFVAIRNGYYYVKSGMNNLTPFTLSKIYIQGIFQNPTEISTFVIKTSNYPINRNILEYLKVEILKTNVLNLLQLPSDTSNDGSGEIIK